MRAKVIEIRDRGTFIAALAVDMNPSGWRYESDGTDAIEAQRYLLRRCGYPCDGRPNICITHLSASGRPAWNDPYAWGDRTYQVAHHYIIDHWDDLKDGDVVDVEYILGETATKKVSERLDRP